MESEQSEKFNERLSQWVSNQGFWFQIRYSMVGTGNQGMATFHLLRIIFRLFLFVLLVASCLGVYLIKRPDYPAFKAELKNSVQAAVSASEVQMGSFSRAQGILEINRFACQGGAETFFTSLEARNVRCKMGFLDGLLGKWDPGTISISILDLDLRAGADDMESAAMISKALFKQSDKVLVNAIEVRDVTLHWGYSERTRGSIMNSSLKVQRVGEGLRMIFKGGTFSQNWLRKLDIVEVVVLCDRDGLVFEKAELRKDQGSIDFSGLKVQGGDRPVVSGLAKIRTLDLGNALPVAMRSFLEGSISGEFKVFGSTNSSEGVGLSGLVALDGQDSIVLRERLHLLKALSVVDYVRNYHRVDFREGSFFMKTGSGGIEVTELDLKSSDLFTLKGGLKLRLPTTAEAQEAVRKTGNATNSSLFNVEDQLDNTANASGDTNNFTLRRAGQAAKATKSTGVIGENSSLFDRLGQNFEIRRLEEQAADRLSKTLRFEGSFVISLLPDAFERAPKLTALFPIETKSNRIPMTVPIEGVLYEVTLKQAEEIYELGAR